MKFLILGVRGMAGHMIAKFLMEQEYEVTGFAREDCSICKTIIGNALRHTDVYSAILSDKFDVVVNAIGVLNKTVDVNLKDGVYINSYLPHFVASCCDEIGAKLIHISSDCVYSGDSAGYVETDTPNETSYYGRTKFLGEVTYGDHLTFRTSIIGPELKSNGVGLFHWFMKQTGEVNGYAHVMWSGVTTLELARAIEKAAVHRLKGLYFLSNNIPIAKHDLLMMFNEYCRKEKAEICKSNFPISNRLLINTRTDFEYVVPPYEEMVSEMAVWIRNYKDLYDQYMEL